MDIERYYKTKAFRSWPHDEDGHIKGPEHDREDFERVVRLTEKISNGDEPTFHAIMETFVKVYPEVKKYKELSAKTFLYPEYGSIIKGISELYQKGQNARTALSRAEIVRLNIKKGMLIAISIKTPNKTYRLKADLTNSEREGVDDSIYIHTAHHDLPDSEELKHILLKNGTKTIYKDDADFPSVKAFLLKTLERSKDERTMWQDFNKNLYETLKTFDQIIRGVKKSENEAYRRPRKVKISREESAIFLKSVLDMDFNEDKLYH